MAEHGATVDPDDLDRLCEIGAAQLHDPIDQNGRHLRQAGIDRYQANTVEEITPPEEYL